MKGNKIDDLFRTGLESHKTPPPSTAWDKIESQLPKESKKGIYFWFSLAASIILIFTFGWIMIQKDQGTQESSEDVLASQKATIKKVEPKKEKDLQDQIKIVPPSELKQQDLVAKKTSPVRIKKAHAPKFKMPSVPVEAVKNANLAVTDRASLPVELVNITLIKVDIKSVPRFFIAEQMSQNAFMKDLSVDLESYLNSYQALVAEPSKRRRFSLLNGIVTVAKGVNNSKIALSEMRKSKNDFFNNDLKYGSKEGDPEEIEDDLNQKQ